MPQLRRNSITYNETTKIFTQLDPPEEKHRVELTEDDKARLIRDFVEVMKREPSEEEVLTLMVEEKKIKQGGR